MTSDEADAKTPSPSTAQAPFTKKERWRSRENDGDRGFAALSRHEQPGTKASSLSRPPRRTTPLLSVPPVQRRDSPRFGAGESQRHRRQLASAHHGRLDLVAGLVAPQGA